jgi:hypothetical protein
MSNPIVQKKTFLELEKISHSTEIIKLIEEKAELKTKEEKAKRLNQIRRGLADAYMAYMNEKIIEAVNKLKTRPNLSIMLKISFFDELTYEDTKVPFHSVHYGGRYEKKWSSRVKDENYIFLFRILQQELDTKGYCLLDESDNSKSHNPFIILYIKKPLDYENRLPLWHGYNRLQIN